MNLATQRPRDPRFGPRVYPYQYWYMYMSQFDGGYVIIDDNNNYMLFDDQNDAYGSWTYGPELPPLHGPSPR